MPKPASNKHCIMFHVKPRVHFKASLVYIMEPCFKLYRPLRNTSLVPVCPILIKSQAVHTFDLNEAL